MAFDPELPPEYQVDPSPGTREFRLAALSGYCSDDEAEQVLSAIESDPEKSYAALASTDAAFVLGVASSLLGRVTVSPKDMEAALIRVGVAPPSDWGNS